MCYDSFIIHKNKNIVLLLLSVALGEHIFYLQSLLNYESLLCCSHISTSTESVFVYSVQLSHQVFSVCFLFVRSDFVYDLFEHVLSRNKQDTLKSSSKHRRPTVSSQFKASPKKILSVFSLNLNTITSCTNRTEVTDL